MKKMVVAACALLVSVAGWSAGPAGLVNVGSKSAVPIYFAADAVSFDGDTFSSYLVNVLPSGRRVVGAAVGVAKEDCDAGRGGLLVVYGKPDGSQQEGIFSWERVGGKYTSAGDAAIHRTVELLCTGGARIDRAAKAAGSH